MNVATVPLAEKKLALLAALQQSRDAQERLAWLVARARERPALPVAEKTTANKITGCLAQLWLVAEFRDKRCYFRCDSDSQIVRAIAGLLSDFYSSQTPDEILAHPPDFLASTGITQHLTSNRQNALARVGETIAQFAKSQL